MKNALIQLIDEGNPKGLFRKIKFGYPLIHSEICKIQETNNLKTYNESIYWILNDIHIKPECPGFSDKCTKDLRFITLEKGYSTSCFKCCMKDPSNIDKMKKTMIEKYGVENAAQLSSVIEKRKETSLKRYGVESTNQLESIKEKKKNTLLNNYGEAGLGHDSINQKKKLTNLEKYGKEWATQVSQVQDKRKDTCLEKYGVDNVMKVEEVKKKVSESLQSQTYIDYVNKLIESRGFKLLSEYNHAHDNIKLLCQTCNHDFDILWNSFQQGNGVCPTCYPRTSGSSKSERDVNQFIVDLGFETDTNVRNIINPYELDIVIRQKNIAIEFCGLWCHSSGGNAPYLQNKNYHKNKLEMGEQNGFQLITIFEDEWILKKDIVKDRLRYILGKSSSIKIRSSKCIVSKISFSQRKEFLNKYHIQGDKISQLNFGLFYENNLVSVMSFSETKNEKCFELDRFCSDPSYIVYGGASKLLKYFKENIEWNEILSYADRRWSVGGVYKKLGFNLETITEPNYWYWGKNIKGRAHRLNFRRDKIKEFKHYNENLTEFQIMALSGFAWIYDCGNYKFVMLKN